jgi:hypothetical protein
MAPVDHQSLGPTGFEHLQRAIRREPRVQRNIAPAAAEDPQDGGVGAETAMGIKRDEVTGCVLESGLDRHGHAFRRLGQVRESVGLSRYAEGLAIGKSPSASKKPFTERLGH